jgi:hypothetical protein
LLGTLSDAAIARRLNRTVLWVKNRRETLGNASPEFEDYSIGVC